MKKLHLAIIITLLVFIGVGVGILIWVLLSNETFVRDVELESEGVTTKELAYSAENFLPGQTREYALTVHCGEAGEFSVAFSAKSTGEGTLWKYLGIEIVCGEVSKEVALTELFEGSSLGFDISLQEDAPMRFTIRYKMPLDVGNEAQKERADFVLLLTAERK